MVLSRVPVPLPVRSTGVDRPPQLPAPVDDAQLMTLEDGHDVRMVVVILDVGGLIARGAREWHLQGGERASSVNEGEREHTGTVGYDEVKGGGA